MAECIKLMILMYFVGISCEAEVPSNQKLTPDIGATAIDPHGEEADAEPPIWTDNARLSAVKVKANRAVLAWTPATDNRGVAHYELQQDGSTIATKVAHQLGGEILGLSPSTDYMFQVIAIDESGNRSNGGPSMMIRTPDEVSPIWSNGSILTGSEISEDGLRLN